MTVLTVYLALSVLVPLVGVLYILLQVDPRDIEEANKVERLVTALKQSEVKGEWSATLDTMTYEHPLIGKTMFYHDPYNYGIIVRHYTEVPGKVRSISLSAPYYTLGNRVARSFVQGGIEQLEKERLDVKEVALQAALEKLDT